MNIDLLSCTVLLNLETYLVDLKVIINLKNL